MTQHHPREEVENILDSISEGVFTIDENFRITSFNRAAEDITGVPREEALGAPCREVFRSTICETGCVLRETMDTGRPIINRTVSIVAAGGDMTPISVSTALLRDESGAVVGGVETFRDMTLVEDLRRELRGTYTFQDLIGKSSAMRSLFALLPRVADSDSTVLVEGHSGTGKELVARAIHNLGPRKDEPFIPVNLGALPDALGESELFGHVAGAFTDARKTRPGRFKAADGGTLFLDEIGEVSPALQVKLLRALQDGSFTPLGSDETVTSDVRVIAATNRDLAQETREGRFREDLYYRLDVVHITLPPLAKRRGDIPLLVEHFVDRFNRRMNRDVSGLTDRALAVLTAYDWPGNVRELENTVEYAFVLCTGGLIDIPHLPKRLQPKDSKVVSSAMSLKEVERRAIVEALERNNGRRMATARELGIDKNTLRRKIRVYGIEPG